MTDVLAGIHPLRAIHPKLPKELNVTLRQLTEWERHRDKNDFPDPVRSMGRYRLFNESEVIEWVILWRRATKNLGNGKRINNGKR
jgi:DNA-binding transcriptional MerR regulator